MCMDRIRETHVQAQAYVTVTDTSTQLFICLAVCNWRLSKSYKQFSFRLIENTIRIDCEMCTLSEMEPQFRGFRTRRLFNILSMLLTYLLTPKSRVLLEKLTGFQPVKKFPAFHGSPRFIAAFISTHQLSLSGASSFQSIPPHPTS